MGDAQPATDPTEMRAGMARYVRAIHEAYLSAAMLLPPATRGSMPLLNHELHVAAAGAQRLHVIATTEPLGPIVGPEVEIEDEADGLTWTLRFYDPVVLPALGLIQDTPEDGGFQVRAALGISTHVYHLTADTGAALSEHQAAHAGAGLANSHAKTHRDFETMGQLAPGRETLVDEMRGASVAGLDRAHALLATQIVPDAAEVLALAAGPEPDQDAVRKAVLTALQAGDND